MRCSRLKRSLPESDWLASWVRVFFRVCGSGLQKLLIQKALGVGIQGLVCLSDRIEGFSARSVVRFLGAVATPVATP